MNVQTGEARNTTRSLATRWKAPVCTLCALLLLSSTVRHSQAQVAGDANCDNVIDANDVSALVETAFNSPTNPACGFADVNGDGRVDAGDIVSLARILAPPPAGPVLSYFGIASAEGVAAGSVGSVGAVPIFFRRIGSGFQIVVEGRAGSNGRAPGLTTYNPDPRDPAKRPDIQLLSARALGDGSREVCLGGVPAVDPPTFGPQQPIADALNDIGCNFILSSQGSCTQNSFGQPAFLGSGTQAQFCLLVPRTLALPDGDTLLSVRLRDANGVVGPIRQMIIRVGNDAPPTFTSTATSTRTPTRTATPPFTIRPTNTPTGPRPPSRTPTATPRSASATATLRPTDTPANATPNSPTRTATRSATPTLTQTASLTATGPRPSVTKTPTATITMVPVRTPTPTASLRPTATATVTTTAPRATPTRTATSTATTTRSLTPTRSVTRTASPTPPVTVTPTRTQTRTPRSTPTPTPTDNGAQGPQITYFGLTRADDSLVEPIGNTQDSVPIYTRPAGAGFSLLIEGKPGASRAALGQSTYVVGSDALPDLQIVASRQLGDGSPAICDVTPPDVGGVPALDPPIFDDSQNVIDTVNDLACRFVDGSGQPRGRGQNDACVLFSNGDYRFVSPSSMLQFCGFIDGALHFPNGDTRFTARLRDAQGNVGLPRQIVVRVGQ